MSTSFNSFCLMALLAKYSDVELSTRMVVAGCGWKSYVRVVRMDIDSCPLMNVAPISASMEDDMIFLMIFDTVWMGLLRGVLMLDARAGSAEQLLRK